MTLTNKPETIGAIRRVWRFLHRPWHEKAIWLRSRWESLHQTWKRNVRIPMWLPFGALWLLRKDNLGEALLAGAFDTKEIAFVRRFLQPGMTVLDLGAHHGLYTILASKRVAPSGKVFAFEPSPRERRALRLHVMLNLCSNVSILRLALGNENTEANLFVVEGAQTGCNSLRPPDVTDRTSPVRVRVTRLDDWLDSQKIDRVDFMKIDVEGAELDALKGAERLLNRRPRPVILAEVQDVRTQPWGYQAKEILTRLLDAGYTWFRLLPDGSLDELNPSPGTFEGNFVACPTESITALRGVGNIYS